MAVTITNDAATTRTNLGLGDAATKTVGTASGNIPLVSSLKTVGGSSIIGSGDIATLPSGGSVGQIIKKDSSNNAAWGTDTVGKVLQVVSINDNTQRTITGTAYVTALSATITPTLSTSKILVLFALSATGPGGGSMHGRLYRGSVSLGEGQNVSGASEVMFDGIDVAQPTDAAALASPQYLDSPNTTGATTYAVKCYWDGTMYINRSITQNNPDHSKSLSSTITLMEIGA
jgi:hypothetical protein